MVTNKASLGKGIKSNASTVKWMNQFAGRLDEYSKRPDLLCLAAVLLILTLLRLFGDGLPAASFLRAFVARGAFCGVALIAVAGAVLALLRVSPLAQRLATLPVFKCVAAFSVSTFKRILLRVFLIGILINIAGTLALSFFLDSAILERAEKAKRLQPFIWVQYPGRPPIAVQRRPDLAYEHTLPINVATGREIQFLTRAEDDRFMDRLTSVDVEAISRSLLALFQAKEMQGGSGVNAQLGGLLFGLEREGDSFSRLMTKLFKTAISIRVDDLLPRREQVELYLMLASFGTINGHEVIGIAAAASEFYGVDHTDLTDAQLAELISRLKNPNIYFPYQRGGETPEQYASRKNRLLERARWILQRVEDAGELSRIDREKSEASLLVGLRPRTEVAQSLSFHRLPAVFDEIRERIPDFETRSLEVVVGFDEEVQRFLEESSSDALREIRRLAPKHTDDEIVIDAVVIGEQGSILARQELANIPGGGASHYKPFYYALAIEERALSSMYEFLLAGQSAEQALAYSNNEAAEEVVRRTGPVRVEAFLNSQGFKTTGPFISLALGAGVTGSPTNLASAFVSFGFKKPGYRVLKPSLLTSVRDIKTGEVLFQPKFEKLFEEPTVKQVRRALELCATNGTANKLAALARVAPIAAKTGTAGFINDRGLWEGEGGSWILATDSASNATVAVRVRWKSGRPFEIEGGKSAALVARNFFLRFRRHAR